MTEQQICPKDLKNKNIGRYELKFYAKTKTMPARKPQLNAKNVKRKPHKFATSEVVEL